MYIIVVIFLAILFFIAIFPMFYRKKKSNSDWERNSIGFEKMNNELISDQLQYPITVTFEDGSAETYEDQTDLECNLEDFDSTYNDCKVTDAPRMHRIVSIGLLTYYPKDARRQI